MDYVDLFKWISSAVVIPFAFYVLNQISQSKDDRAKLFEDISKFKLYCSEHYAKNDKLENLRLEIKKDFAELREYIREDLKEIKGKIGGEV